MSYEIEYWSLKCLSSIEDSSIVLMALFPVDTGPLTLQTYTLFSHALQKVRSFYRVYEL
jgi:hypothetical protein